MVRKCPGRYSRRSLPVNSTSVEVSGVSRMTSATITSNSLMRGRGAVSGSTSLGCSSLRNPDAAARGGIWGSAMGASVEKDVSQENTRVTSSCYSLYDRERAMELTIDLPQDISESLQGQWGNVPRHALEA